MMNFKLTTFVVCAAFWITNPLVVKGDTEKEFQFFEQKIEMVNIPLENKENVIKMTENGDQAVVNEETHPLEPLMNAIIYVESRGNPKAHNKKGDCVGILQITKICVRECNNVLRKKGSKKRYTYADRWDKDKSIEMFYLLQDYYNPKHDIKKAIRIWNKRPSYMKLVMKAYNSQK